MYEKIKAEIERLMHNRDSRLVDGSYFDFKELLSFIESLEKEQPKEVDLEREINTLFYDEGWSYLEDINKYVFASHFYELGKNARKEK